MKTSIAKLCPEFNMHRAVMQYTDRYYSVAHGRYLALQKTNGTKTKELAATIQKLRSAWPELSVVALPDGISEIRLGDPIHLSARIMLGPLTPEDVTAQVLIGRIDSSGEITQPAIVPMHARRQSDSGSYLFEATVQPANKSGLYGYAIRLLPRDLRYISPFSTGLVKWADQQKEPADIPQPVLA
jgi:starch phosphorylase